MKVDEIKELISLLPETGSISRRQLSGYLRQKDSALNLTTLNWRIHELKQKNILQEVATGWYSTEIKQDYLPVPDRRIKKINKLLTDNYRGTTHAIWNINWLNEFTRHQFSRDVILVEVEKDLVLSTKDTLKDNGFRDVLLSQWFREPHFSFADFEKPVVILPIISRSPVQPVKTGPRSSVYCPSLEKILVDIFDNERLFYFLQGAELENIFYNALQHYSINRTTVLGYAKRRGKYPALRAFLTQHFQEFFNHMK